MKIIRDIGLLQIAKFVELLIPIVAIPIVIKNLGLYEFGAITKILALSAYCVMIGEWGFNTNLVSFFKVNTRKTRVLFLVFIDLLKIRLIYAVSVSFIMMTLVVLNILELFSSFVIMLWIIANIFQCRWFFQARDKLVSYTLVSVISKIGSLYYVFLIMDENSVKESYLLSLALPIVFISLYGNLYTFRMLSIKCKFDFFKFSSYFKVLLYEGWNLISSRMISNSFNPIVIYLTGQFYSNEVVGLLGIFQKITMGVVAFLTPINEVIYPKLAGLYAEYRYEYKKIFMYQLLALIAMFIMFILCFGFLDVKIFSYFNVESRPEVIISFYIYSFTILTNLMNMAFVNALVIKARTKFISIISVGSVIIAISMFYILSVTTILDFRIISLIYVIQQGLSLTLVISYYNWNGMRTNNTKKKEKC